jgi:hypothetical protein
MEQGKRALKKQTFIFKENSLKFEIFSQGP